MSKQNATLRRIAAAVLMLPLLVLCGWRTGVWLEYGRSIEGHLKRAADANTVEMAERELETALAVLEDRGMTDGYSSVFYKTPGDDIGFWYGNLKTSLAELKSLPPEAAPLEKSNMLIKLRETILDHDSDGESVTAPSGISAYPHNRLFAVLCVLFCVLFLAGGNVARRVSYLRRVDLTTIVILSAVAYLVPMGLTMF